MPWTTAQPFVRPYDPSRDLEDVVHVFRETCDDSLKIEPIWTIGEYIWCRSYVFLTPETCSVLDDGCGKAVGYIVGTSDSQNFCENWKSNYVFAMEDTLQRLSNVDVPDGTAGAAIEHRQRDLLYLIRNKPGKLVYGNLSSALEHWSGHFHIDILPSHQRRGYGKMLIDSFLDAVEKKCCSGVFLAMVASNSGAARFYESCGFRRLPVTLDDGESGELGRTKKGDDGGEQVYFVKDISTA